MIGDKRLVYVMSTNTKGDGSTTCQRKEKNGSTSTVAIPMNTFLYKNTLVGLTKPINSVVITNGNSSLGSFTCKSSGTI